MATYGGLKDINVIIDSDDAQSATVDYAVRLAQRHEAHLTGVYIRPQISMPMVTDAAISAELVTSAERAVETDAEAAGQAFDTRMKDTGLAYDVRVFGGFRHDPAVQFLCVGDLTVISQPQRGQRDRVDIWQDLVMSSGRPVLTIPYAGQQAHVGDEVAIAWNGSREAARAVGTATPLLAAAKRVHVVSFAGPGGSHESAFDGVPGAELALHLARRGIECEVEALPQPDIGIGEALLSWVADKGIDMLVMGAYGHSRFREWVFGGASHTILQSMTVPVLMAH